MSSALVPVALVVAGSPASAGVITDTGNAYGYSLHVSLFGGPVNTRGVGQVACANPPTNTLPSGCAPTPTASSSPSVVLPTSGGNVTQTDADGTVGSVGPATFFSSGQLTTSSSGTTGATGSVTSSTSISNINSSLQESLTVTKATSTCSANKARVSGSATFIGATLAIDSGDDLNNDGDFTDPGEHAPVTVAVPTNPTASTTFDGHIHVNGTNETFRYVFNEQVPNPDGSITVYAGHEYILGPTAVGNLYFGEVQCGVGLPELRIGDTTVAEGDSGTRGAPLTVRMSRSSPSAVSFSWTGSDGSAGTTSIPAGSLYGTVSPSVRGNTVDAPDSSVTVTLTSATGATITDNTGVVTILDDDPPAAGLRLTVADVTQWEGDAGSAKAQVLVSLSAAAPASVTFTWATAAGTASTGSDYTAVAGSSATIAAGKTSVTLKVTVKGDLSTETNETFLVQVSGVTGATVADGTGQVTIANDD